MRYNPIKPNGFTLVEVLVSMVILAIGLLGMAAMQATTLKSNLSAYQRSQATQLAYEMADRIRANLIASNSYVVAEDALAGKQAAANCTTVAGCTATDMANTDLADWYAALIASLPLARGSIAIDGPTRVATITIRWDENRNGLDNNDLGFSMSFQL